jgi:hypothetical protein
MKRFGILKIIAIIIALTWMTAVSGCSGASNGDDRLSIPQGGETPGVPITEIESDEVVSIKGRVIDMDTKTGIAAGIIIGEGGHHKSGNNGAFAIDIPAGKGVIVRVKSDGYKETLAAIKVGTSTDAIEIPLISADSPQAPLVLTFNNEGRSMPKGQESAGFVREKSREILKHSNKEGE